MKPGGETRKADVSQEARHLSEVAQNARKTFFGILAGCAYSFLTIATTHDIDLLGNARDLELPIVGVDVPVVWFYSLAPALLIALYFYFHLYLLEMWRGMAQLRSKIGAEERLEGYLYPWVLTTGMIRAYRLSPRDSDSVTEALEDWIPILLAWALVPVTVFFFWARYLMRHDWRVTALHSVILALSIAGGLMFHRRAVRVLAGRAARLALGQSRVRTFKGLAATAALAAAILLLSASTMGSAPRRYCDEVVFEPATCGPLYSGGRIFSALGRPPYAELSESDASGALMRGLDIRHARAENTKLPNADLRGADLRWVVFNGAQLPGADLRGAKAHHAQLEAADFSGAQLERAEFRGAVLGGADLKGSVVAGADFSQALLWGAELTKASGDLTILEGADLREAELLEAELPKAKLDDAELFGARLNHADLRGATMIRANLNRAELKATGLIDADLRGASLRQSDLEGAELVRAQLQEADLFDADLADVWAEEADLTSAVLELARLPRADLRGATMEDCDLTGADLTDALLGDGRLARATLQGAMLMRASLPGVDLTEADLSGADLSGANLSDANLSGAILAGAELTEATLTGADLSRADLTGVIGLEPDQLREACGDQSIGLPPRLRLAPCPGGA